MSHCHWNTCPHSVVNFEDEQQRRSSSSRLARAHERAGRGRARRASKRGTEDTPCPVVVRSWRSVLWGDHVIDGEGNAGTSSRRQAAIVCELRKPLVQDKYSVKAKAQQLMYGFMGLYSIFRQSSEAITWSIIWPRIRRLYLYTRPHAQPRIWPRRGIDTRLHVFPRISRSPQPLSCAGGVPVTMP